MQKIMENQLTHMKIPLKIAVVEDTGPLKIDGWDSGGLYEIDCDQIKIYSEEIKRVERKLSRNEIDEFFQLIAKANFLDLWPKNIVLAEDGVYFIDTEFKSFAGSVCWEKMGRFKSLIREEDKDYFEEKVQEKISESKPEQEINKYDFLKSTLSFFSKIFESSNEESKDKIEEINNKILKLEYVGAKQAGSFWTIPNKFIFNLEEILT